MTPNKSLQPTAAALVSWTVVGNLIVTVAFRSQSPAAVAEF
jgi:23S rRNA maturation-related 3'-5' exoribonuclease YhaM